MPVDQEVDAVSEQHRFDEQRLEEYLRESLSDFSGPLTVSKFKGGQSNPTFLLDTPNRRYVLRKKPPGKLLKGAHQVEREYRVIHALQNTNVPVAKTWLLCEDESIIGTSFYVMECVEGRVFRNPQMPELNADERANAYEQVIVTLAKLHAVDWRAVGLEGYGKTENYCGRQVATWTRQYEASRTEDIPTMTSLIAWLNDNLPDDDLLSIAHGDYRPENMIFAADRMEVSAVLDWELSTLGHPYADVGYLCMGYYLPNIPMLGGLKGMKLEDSGIPTEQALVARYCQHAGIDGIPNHHFFVALALFRIAAIVQGVYKRALDGNASSPTAKMAGQLVPVLADAGWQVAQGGGQKGSA